MGLTLANRLLLRKALLLRRVSRTPVDLSTVVEAVEEDEELVRQNRPDLYIGAPDWDIRALIDECVEDGVLDWNKKQGLVVISRGLNIQVYRTRLGEQFIQGLEPVLAQLADEAPMSNKNLLDWLARM